MRPLKTTAIGLALLAGPAFAEMHASGDAAEGESVFNKCKACHQIVDAEGETIVRGGRTGPNLYGIYMRQAGTEEEFGNKYGDSLVEAGEAGLMWNEEEFVKYAEDPRGYLQEYLDNRRARSKMSFKLRDEEERKNVWAYLVSVGPEVEAEEGSESSD